CQRLPSSGANKSTSNKRFPYLLDADQKGRAVNDLDGERCFDRRDGQAINGSSCRDTHGVVERINYNVRSAAFSANVKFPENAAGRVGIMKVNDEFDLGVQFDLKPQLTCLATTSKHLH
ncbi:MAG: hypothetical protein ACTHMB_08800, partial [Candidatus Binatia bacterium]